jgi:hypothetical protein
MKIDTSSYGIPSEDDAAKAAWAGCGEAGEWYILER